MKIRNYRPTLQDFACAGQKLTLSECGKHDEEKFGRAKAAAAKAAVDAAAKGAAQ
jgi:hypothetical protein